MKTKKDLYIPFSWEDRKPIFLERFFYVPKAFQHVENRFQWSDRQVFGNDKPVYLELCSGNGQWIGERAKRNPDCNWVAVDLDFSRARMAWAKSFREEIPNLYVVCAEGNNFLRYYAPKRGAARAYINFPDPWPKRRHAKHRLVQKPFLDVLSGALQEGASLFLTTDDAPYRDQMIEELAKGSFWRPLLASPYYTSDLAHYGESYFSSLWRQKKRTLYCLEYANVIR